MHYRIGRRELLVGAGATGVAWSLPIRAASAALIAPQPFFATAKRAIAALSQIGQPIGSQDAANFQILLAQGDTAAASAADEILQKYTIANVTLKEDGYAVTTPGTTPKRLVEQGWSAFLVRLENPTQSDKELKVTGAQATITYPSAGAAYPAIWDTLNNAPRIAATWFRNELYRDPPIGPNLSGSLLEYQLLHIFCRDRGLREMILNFYTNDEVGEWHEHMLAFGGARLSFECRPSRDVTFRVQDSDGQSCIASFVIKDAHERIYPLQAMRLAPDMYFQPQIYRANAESVRLPDGDYAIEVRRGPEYLAVNQTVTIGDGRETIDANLERWINPAKWGWYSGDTHIHPSGCSHYEHPTEGVTPPTMIRQARGEGLYIADVLIWAIGRQYQERFFSGHAISPPALLEEPALQQANGTSLKAVATKTDKLTTLRYDQEISGFPSSHSGHLVLLRLSDLNYPGTRTVEDWPSWNLPILKWARAQGALAGYAHSGWGMLVDDRTIPHYEIPPMDGNGAQEAIVDAAHGYVDFLSVCDTVPSAELNTWYHLLNCGFRMAIVGETDFPCISSERPGMGRSYVRLEAAPEGDSGYDAWVQGIAKGRLYCGDGRSHILDWSVAHRRSGEENVQLKMPSRISVDALVAARLEPKPQVVANPFGAGAGWHLEKARLGDTRQVTVELIVNGRSVEQTHLLADGKPRRLTFSTTIERSSWVALRILPSVHTHPVFVEVDGEQIRASKRSAQWCRQCVDKLWEVKSPMIRESERAAAAEAYDHARRVYDQIIAESDVT